MTSRAQRIAALKEALTERILIFDGAMGTMIQRLNPDEAAFRGERFTSHDRDLKGNNDLLNLTQPEAIREILISYLEAGADIVGTNTFSSTSIAQADYGMERFARELNVEGAKIARHAADMMSAKKPSKPRFVAGCIGPTNKTASISPDVNDPGFRNVTFDELKIAFREQVEGLAEGGVDVLLVETIIDTLNAKAALFAIEEFMEESGERLPVMISGTITDQSGRLLSGQTPEAFWNSLRHAKPLTIGLNCALGATQLRPHVAELARTAETYICAYPNAGLPNEFGEYDEQPHATAEQIGAWAKDGLVNIVGGCCGTTPDHIKAIADAVDGMKPRLVPTTDIAMRLSGLEPFKMTS